jgi:hypothetical protein
MQDGKKGGREKRKEHVPVMYLMTVSGEVQSSKRGGGREGGREGREGREEGKEGGREGRSTYQSCT